MCLINGLVTGLQEGLDVLRIDRGRLSDDSHAPLNLGSGLQPLIIQGPLVPGVVGLPRDLQSGDDGNACFLLLRAQSQKPGDCLQLLVEKIVIVESLVTDSRARPSSGLESSVQRGY